MKISEAYPSDYLKADDLKGQEVTVTISAADMEDIGQGHNKERKLILSFRGKEKKLVCNKTNANTISKLYGDDTDNWLGQPIIIGPREVEFQGDMVWAIRVSLKKPASAAVTAPKTPAPAPDLGVNESDIPF